MRDSSAQGAGTPAVESYPETGLTEVSFAGTVVVSLADQAVASAANVLTGIVVGRACGKEEYGLYVLGFALVVFAVNVQNALVSTPYMVRYPVLADKEKPAYTGSVLLQQLGLGFAAALFAAGWAAVALAFKGGGGLPVVLGALALALPLLLLRDFTRRLLFAQLRMKAALAMDSTIALLGVGALVGVALSDRLSAPLAFLLVAGACGLPVGAVLLGLRRTIRFEKSRLGGDFLQHWRFGRWVFLGAFLGSLSQVLSPWALAAFRSTAEAGVWGACASVAAACNPLLLGIQNFLGPRIAHAFAGKDRRVLARTVYRWTVFFAAVIALVALPIGIMGGKVVTMLYGPAFSGHGAVVAFLMAGLVALAAGFPFSRGLYVLNRPKVDCAVNALGLFVFAGVGLPLMSVWGALGAAVAFLCAHIACAGARAAAFGAVLRSDPALQSS